MTTTARARSAFRATVEAPVDSIVRYLQEVLGNRLVAYLAGVEDAKTVGRWASGGQRPRAEAEQRLRTAFQIFQLLLQGDDSHTVRAWFIGLNPQLNDTAPAEAIRDGALRDTWAAARAYASGG